MWSALRLAAPADCGVPCESELRNARHGHTHRLDSLWMHPRAMEESGDRGIAMVTPRDLLGVRCLPRSPGADDGAKKRRLSRDSAIHAAGDCSLPGIHCCDPPAPGVAVPPPEPFGGQFSLWRVVRFLSRAPADHPFCSARDELARVGRPGRIAGSRARPVCNASLQCRAPLREHAPAARVRLRTPPAPRITPIEL